MMPTDLLLRNSFWPKFAWVTRSSSSSALIERHLASDLVACIWIVKLCYCNRNSCTACWHENWLAVDCINCKNTKNERTHCGNWVLCSRSYEDWKLIIIVPFGVRIFSRTLDGYSKTLMCIPMDLKHGDLFCGYSGNSNQSRPCHKVYSELRRPF